MTIAIRAMKVIGHSIRCRGHFVLKGSNKWRIGMNMVEPAVAYEKSYLSGPEAHPFTISYSDRQTDEIRSGLL
jgi:hypothetical protein